MSEDGRIRDHVFVREAWRDSITYSILEHVWTPIDDIGTENRPPAVTPDTDRGQER